MAKKNFDPIKQFQKERRIIIKKLGRNKRLKSLGLRFMIESLRHRYSYSFDWLGRPIIQHPQDIVAVQELIWKVKPDLVIETGIAHGGSLILSASILELIGGKGGVLGIDIEIRPYNRAEIEKHRMFKRIKLIEGPSTDPAIITQVKKIAKGKKRVMVLLDSSHTHDHVLQELKIYSPFVTKGSYIIVFDTIIEYMGRIPNRPWRTGNNSLTAVKAFLRRNKKFIVDKEIENKLLITANPGGYLKRIR